MSVYKLSSFELFCSSSTEILFFIDFADIICKKRFILNIVPFDYQPAQRVMGKSQIVTVGWAIARVCSFDRAPASWEMPTVQVEVARLHV